MSAKPPRVIVVHSRVPILLYGLTQVAHAFGPFESEAEAKAFTVASDDDCFHFCIEIVGPDEEDAERARFAEAVAIAPAPSGLVN